MAQAVVNIAGRTYRMNCDDGEEGHIEDLARRFQAKIEDLRASFGEIGDQRIVVMAALTVADELHIAQKQLAEARSAIAAAKADAERARLRQLERAEWAAQALDKATARIIAATRALNDAEDDSAT